jgi:hypothetical protein
MGERIVLLVEDELEVGVLTMELARLTGNARPRPELMEAAGRLERKLASALERRFDQPTIAEIGHAIELLARVGLVEIPPANTADELAQTFAALRSAVEFYADHRQYERNDVAPREHPVLVDRGARARRALRASAAPPVGGRR